MLQFLRLRRIMSAMNLRSAVVTCNPFSSSATKLQDDACPTQERREILGRPAMRTWILTTLTPTTRGRPMSCKHLVENYSLSSIFRSPSLHSDPSSSATHPHKLSCPFCCFSVPFYLSFCFHFILSYSVFYLSFPNILLC